MNSDRRLIEDYLPIQAIGFTILAEQSLTGEEATRRLGRDVRRVPFRSPMETGIIAGIV